MTQRCGWATRSSTDTWSSSRPARRYNTLLAATSDLRVFFTEIDKEPADVVVSDVLAFITAQRQPLFEGKVVRLSDGWSGLMATPSSAACRRCPGSSLIWS